MRFIPKLSAFGKVVAGLVLGIVTGLFFGERVGFLSVGGDIYIKLLQMTVLPYILVSLIGGLGRLDASMARRIGSISGLLILFIWGTTLVVMTFIPLAYPEWTSATFFSTSLVGETAPFDPMTLYLPANPFYSLANTIVPAVVVFAVCVGLALIAVPDKAGLLRGLDNLGQALMKIASFVARLAPLGIFAISAAAAGTLRLEELGRLQVYLWTYLGAWSVLSLFTLPALVAWATPLSYREVLRLARLPMLTAFAVGTVLVVIPMIVERCMALLKEKDIQGDEVESTVEVLAPTAYSFPSAGTLLGLAFILFAAWFSGSSLTPAQYPTFTVVGALSAFGTMAVALPFMLDFFRLPTDLFQLYLLGSVITARFATALAAMHGVTICLLGSVAIAGGLKWSRMFQVAGLSAALACGLMLALGFVQTHLIPYEYTGYQSFVTMQLRGPTVEVKHHDSLPPLSEADRQRPRMEVIRERGELRVGYLSDRLPYAFRNDAGDVVGFDMELMHALARQLNVSLSVVRLDWESLGPALASGQIDVLVGGIVVTAERAERFAFSRSYVDQTIGFIVRDHDRNRFADVARMRRATDLTIAVPLVTYEQGARHEWLLNAEFVQIDSPRPFLRGDMPNVDALAFSAETGAAWTLVYPKFSVIVPRGSNMKVPVAFGLPAGDLSMKSFLDTWLELVTKSGFVDSVHRRWILGEDEQRHQRRWSILEDVIGLTPKDTEQPAEGGDAGKPARPEAQTSTSIEETESKQ